MIRGVLEVVRFVTFCVGEYGGQLLDWLTGRDYAREEAEIRESIRRQYEGE